MNFRREQPIRPMVWRHDVNANNFFSLAGYVRHACHVQHRSAQRAGHTADPGARFRPPIGIAMPTRQACDSITPTCIAKEHLIRPTFSLIARSR